MPVTSGGNISAVAGLGAPLRNAGAPGAGTDEVQTVTINNFGACTLTLVYGGQTATVAFAGTENNTAIDTAVTAALEGLSTIGSGNVSVSVSGTTNRAMAITFIGALAKRAISAIGATASGGSAVAATLSTNLTGSNNDLTYTAVTGGTAGNSITIAYVDPAGNDQALSVGVAGSAITVSLATGVAGAITSTAALIAAAIAASTPAAALVTVANKAGNDGTGVVTALSATPLAGGLAAPVAAVVETTPGVNATGRSAAVGAQLLDTTNGVAYVATVAGPSPTFVKVGTQS